MEKIKLKTVTIALIAIVMTLISQSSLAYYSTIGKATNVVTTGNIQFIIHETTDQGTSFPDDGVYIVPGDVVSKQVSIESDCDYPFYLRVKIVSGIDSEELSSDECFKLNIDESNWQYVDGWYYYNDIVKPGENTPYVFSTVEIVGDKVDNNYLGKTLTLTVVAHAVQSENNPIQNNDTSTASGWPQE